MISRYCKHFLVKICRFSRLRHYSLSTARCGFLSSTYGCQDKWKQRLQDPILQKVNVGDFAMTLHEKFDKEGRASAVDIDIIANKLEKVDPIQLDFVLNLFYRLRHTKDAIHVPESLHHGVIRALVKLGETEKLLDILRDKLHYGIFLDYYTANILMDHFLDNKMYKAAAEVACDQMLQEDFAHPITRYLAWYSCHMYKEHELSRQIMAEKEAAVAEAEQQDEEEDWFRVPFIINPYYDDHFDIPRESLRVGKTLTMVTDQDLDSVLGRSNCLMGWAMYEKYDKGLEALEGWSQDVQKDVVAKSALDFFHESLNNIEPREPPPEKEHGFRRIKDLYPIITAEMKEEYQAKLQTLRESLQSKGQVMEYDLEQQLTQKLQHAVEKLEPHDKAEQLKLFEKWQQDRRDELDRQVSRLKEQDKRSELIERLRHLQSREEKLSFFEQLDKIDLTIDAYPKMKPIEDETEEEQYVGAPSERGKGF